MSKTEGEIPSKASLPKHDVNGDVLLFSSSRNKSYKMLLKTECY